MTQMVRVRVTEAVEAILMLDEASKWPGLEVVTYRNHKRPYWTLYAFPRDVLVTAIAEAQDRCDVGGEGWCYDNPGAAVSSLRAFVKHAQAALEATPP